MQPETPHVTEISGPVVLPQDGLLLGNGDLSVSLYQTANRLVWRFGKGDVWDRRWDRSRDPRPPHIDEIARGIRDTRTRRGCSVRDVGRHELRGAAGLDLARHRTASGTGRGTGKGRVSVVANLPWWRGDESVIVLAIVPRSRGCQVAGLREVRHGGRRGLREAIGVMQEAMT